MERNLATSSSPPVNLGSIFFADGGVEGGGGGRGDAVVERALSDASLRFEEDQNQPIFALLIFNLLSVVLFEKKEIG